MEHSRIHFDFDPTARGSCLCGAVRYELVGPFEVMSHCHCSMCRKHHGTSFATFVCAPLAKFRWIRGEKSIRTFQTSPFGARCFCGVCGSVTPAVEPGMGIVVCPAANLEGDLGVKPGAHLFVGSKASWHAITDALPQHVEF